MELWLLLGGGMGALLRKAGEWVAVPDLPTIKGTVIEVIVGGLAVLGAVKMGALPSPLIAAMADPVTAFGLGALAAYAPIDALRNLQDWLSPPSSTAPSPLRRGLRAWR